MGEVNENSEEMPVQQPNEFDYTTQSEEYIQPGDPQPEMVTPQELNPLAENEIITPSDGTEY